MADIIDFAARRRARNLPTCRQRAATIFIMERRRADDERSARQFDEFALIAAATWLAIGSALADAAREMGPG